MKRLILTAATAFVCAVSVRAEDSPPPVEVKAGNLTFQAPAPWLARPAPRMASAGGYVVAGKDSGNPVEMDFYHFGRGQGGGVAANLERWRNQFEKDADGNPPQMKKEEVTAGGRKVTIVQMDGTFLAGPPQGAKIPKPGFRMIAAIVADEDGDVFVKVTGPADAVRPLEDGIRKTIVAACERKAPESGDR